VPAGMMPDAARGKVYGPPAGPHPLHPQGVPSAEGVLVSGMGHYVTRAETKVKITSP